MKIRDGFVSNSSSSSFIIKRKGMTKENFNDINAIIHFSDYSHLNIQGNFSYVKEVDLEDYFDNIENDELLINSTMTNLNETYTALLLENYLKNNKLEYKTEDIESNPKKLRNELIGELLSSLDLCAWDEELNKDQTKLENKIRKYLINYLEEFVEKFPKVLDERYEYSNWKNYLQFLREKGMITNEELLLYNI